MSHGACLRAFVDLPTTMFVSSRSMGLGRPDLALFKFVDAILNGRPIDIYNHGDMYRDFTYVEDLVRHSPADRRDSCSPVSAAEIAPGDSLSPVALSASSTSVIQTRCGCSILSRRSKRSLVARRSAITCPCKWRRAGHLADASLLQQLTGYRPQTDFRDGVAKLLRGFANIMRRSIRANRQGA